MLPCLPIQSCGENRGRNPHPAGSENHLSVLVEGKCFPDNGSEWEYGNIHHFAQENSSVCLCNGSCGNRLQLARLGLSSEMIL